MRQWLRQRQCYQLDSTDVRQIIVLMYVATVTAAQNGVRTHLLVALLLQPHQCEQVHLIQWNPIDSGTVAAAVAAPCERTLTLLHRYTEMTNTQVSGFLFNCVSNDM